MFKDALWSCSSAKKYSIPALCPAERGPRALGAAQSSDDDCVCAPAATPLAGQLAPIISSQVADAFPLLEFASLVLCWELSLNHQSNDASPYEFVGHNPQRLR